MNKHQRFIFAMKQDLNTEEKLVVTNELDKVELINLIMKYSDLYRLEELKNYPNEKLRTILKYYLLHDVRMKLDYFKKN